MNLDASFLITSYNYQNYIQQCIESCINQKTDLSFEIIVVDDGSTDDTKNILSKFSNHKNIKIFFRKNSGVEKSSNFAIKQSNGTYISRIDADDFVGPNFLEKNLKTIRELGSSFIYSNYNAVDSQENVIWTSDLPDFNKNEIVERGDFLATGTIYKKSEILGIGSYNEKFKNCGLENYELVLKLINAGKSGVLNKDNLFSYRIHDSNMSTERRDSIIEYGKNMIKKLGFNEYKTNKNHPYRLKLDNGI